MHQWFLRAEAATGTELTREALDASYRWRPAGGEPRARADLTWFGRQYRQGSDYDLVSDNHEGRLEARLVPWLGRGAVLEARAVGRWLDYRTPSTLEQDFREAGGALYLRAPAARASRWEAGLRATRRTYPDSAAIDRDVVGADVSANGLAGDLEYWGFHRSERRLIADETMRPSAWSHWTDLNLTCRSLVANVTSEVWRYDREDDVYVDSWRLENGTGLPLGRPAARAVAGVAHRREPRRRRLARDLPPGGRARRASSRTSRRSPGSLAVEVGRRWYEHPAAASEVEALLAYSDFTYVEIWLLGSVAARDEPRPRGHRELRTREPHGTDGRRHPRLRLGEPGVAAVSVRPASSWCTRRYSPGPGWRVKKRTSRCRAVN